MTGAAMTLSGYISPPSDLETVLSGRATGGAAVVSFGTVAAIAFT
jgi:hypothetical protein